MTGRIARVAVVSPLPGLDHLFDYRIPEKWLGDARVGARVKVRFGNRRRSLDGFIVEIVDHAEKGVVPIDIDKVVSPVPVLTPAVWRLARAVADRQGGVASDVLRLAIPPRQARVEQSWSIAVPVDEVAASQARERKRGDGGQTPSRVALLARAGGVQVAGRWHPLWAVDVARRASALRRQNSQMIVVVPDYRDIAVVCEALEAAAPELVVVRLDTGGAATARYRAFLDVLAGQADVVVGNRQAVYAPAARLGGIYVWEDGDPSQVEQHAPYAHTRDVAMVRSSLEGADLVFASNSRSTAVQRLVEIGWLAEQQLGEAASVIPSGQLFGADDGRAGIPEPVWRMASAALDAGGQVLVQVARRGYARVLLCEECRTPARCSVCGGPLGLASNARSTPTCRWCGHPEPGFRCGVCGGTALRQASPGVERTSRDIGRAFPRALIVTSTGDQPVAEIAPGRTVVMATPGVEPIAQQGGYDLVILLDCEWMLGREGLTAVEDAVRQWFAAAAHVRPAGKVVAMGVEGRLARALNVWRPDIFASDELAARRAAGFPPARRVCAVTGPAGSTRKVIESAVLPGEVSVIGTVPVPSEPSDVSGRSHERTLISLPYSAGGEVARSLKAAAMQAPQRLKEWGIRPVPGETAPVRIRFDDVESL